MTFRSSHLLNGLSATLLAAVWSFPAIAGNTPAAATPHAVPGELPVVVIDEPVTLVLVRIRGGRFRMGDTQSIGQADERPIREVRVGDFWMMRTEVTRRMFALFAEEKAYETGSKCWVFEDLYGNVWEWVEDCWNDSYGDAPTNGSGWLTGDCARRGFRGGGYGDIPRFARSSLRNRSNAEHRKDDIGFRLVLDEAEVLTGRR